MKSWYFDKINKVDNTFSKLIKRQNENTQIIKISNEKGDVTIDTVGMKTIRSSNFRSLYSKKMDNLNDFLDRHQLSNFNPDLKSDKVIL